MDTITKHLPFVNEQIEVQEKLAKRYASEGQQWRENLHLLSAEKFKSLARDMEQATQYLKDSDRKPSYNKTSGQQLSLSFDEIQGLPNELISELSISDADRVGFIINSIIDDSGGMATLDRILIGLYKKTNEVHKRTDVTNRLYRMAQKDLVYSVSGKKGVYSNIPVIDPKEIDEVLDNEPKEAIAKSKLAQFFKAREKDTPDADKNRFDSALEMMIKTPSEAQATSHAEPDGDCNDTQTRQRKKKGV